VDRIVLGAGPVGLVSSYLLGADLTVAEAVGGTGLRRFAPTFLWRTPETEALLDELGLPAEPRTVRFGYLADDGVREEFSDAERVEYFRRSRGLPAGAPVEVPESAMSSGSSGRIETFEISVDDVVGALSHHVEVTLGRVLAVEVRRTDGRRVPKVRVAVSGGREFWTRQLVNTLPAPAFDAVSRHEDEHNRAAPREWPAGHKTFLRVPIEAVSAELRRARDELDLAYLYVVSPDRVRFAYDRVTFLDDVAVLEFNREEAVPTGGDWERLERFSGRLQVSGPSRDPVEYGGAVWHVGRLARWHHGIRIHSVVEDMYEYAENA
jgi:hypothetical protein